MIRNRRDLNELLGRLDTVAASRADYRERLYFCRATLEYLMGRREASGPPPPAMTEREAKLRLEEGFPLMDRLALEPDREAMGETFDGLISLAEEMTGLSGETIARAREWRGGDDFTDRLMDYFRSGELETALAATLDEEGRELLQFLFHGAMRPYHERHAVENGGLEALSGWSRGYCPVCGGRPALGVLKGEEGHRFLLCGRCGFLWPFPRVRCPFCDNTNHEKLRYMYFEKEPGYRVDVCDACRAYLKQVDSRQFPGELIPEAEDLSTPHLDLLAQQEGFVKKAPNILGLFR